MFLVPVLSTVFVLVSATNQTKENSAVNDVGGIIMEESQKGAKELAAFWGKNEKTDQKSIQGFLKERAAIVFGKAKGNVISLVKNSLGEDVSQPENTDMYKVLLKIIQKYTTELTFRQAATIAKDQQITKHIPTQGGDDKLSKTIASFYDEIANKNVTEEEKSNLIGESQKQIDDFIKTTFKGDKSKSKLASRAGAFFYDHSQHQQQERSSSSVAHKLTHHMMNNMCAPQPTYTNNCYRTCPQCSCCRTCPQCNQCMPSQEQGINYGERIAYSQDHRASMDSSMSSSMTGSSTGILGGSGHLIGSGLPSTGILGSGSYGNLGSSLSYSGNSHNSHSSSMDASMSGSINQNTGYYGAQGTGLGDVKGSYTGIANLWSLNKAGRDSSISGSSYGGSSYDSRLGGNSHLDGASYGGGVNSYGLNNIHGQGLGNVGGGGQYSEQYSASNRKSSSRQSDSSSNHLAYGSSGNIW